MGIKCGVNKARALLRFWVGVHVATSSKCSRPCQN